MIEIKKFIQAVRKLQKAIPATKCRDWQKNLALRKTDKGLEIAMTNGFVLAVIVIDGATGINSENFVWLDVKQVEELIFRLSQRESCFADLDLTDNNLSISPECSYTCKAQGVNLARISDKELNTTDPCQNLFIGDKVLFAINKLLTKGEILSLKTDADFHKWSSTNNWYIISTAPRERE